MRCKFFSPSLYPLRCEFSFRSRSAVHCGCRYGKEIDKHDVVMRFNNAPTEHNEHIVGSKTSIRVTNSRYQVCDAASLCQDGNRNFMGLSILICGSQCPDAGSIDLFCFVRNRHFLRTSDSL